MWCYLPPSLGVPPGPAYGKLKNGISVVLENGVTISPQDVLKKPIVGRKICILGDCSGVVGDGGVKLCFEADLLIHEATLDDAQMDKAKEHGHSTPQMAAAFAKLCQAKRLVLTHFSQRYKPVALAREGETDGIVELKKQAESVFDFQEVTLAEDFMVIGIPIKKWSQRSWIHTDMSVNMLLNQQSLLLLFWSKIIWVPIILKMMECHCWTDSAVKGSKCFLINHFKNKTKASILFKVQFDKMIASSVYFRFWAAASDAPHAVLGLASAQLYCCYWQSAQGLALLAKNGIVAVCVESVHVINRMEV